MIPNNLDKDKVFPVEFYVSVSDNLTGRCSVYGPNGEKIVDSGKTFLKEIGVIFPDDPPEVGSEWIDRDNNILKVDAIGKSGYIYTANLDGQGRGYYENPALFYGVFRPFNKEITVKV